MSLVHLGIAYGAIGLAAAGGLAVARRLSGADMLLVLVLWPIWVPLALTRTEGAVLEARIRELSGHAEEVAALKQRTLERLHAERGRVRAELAAIEKQIEEYRLEPGALS